MNYLKHVQPKGDTNCLLWLLANITGFTTYIDLIPKYPVLTILDVPEVVSSVGTASASPMLIKPRCTMSPFLGSEFLCPTLRAALVELNKMSEEAMFSFIVVTVQGNTAHAKGVVMSKTVLYTIDPASATYGETFIDSIQDLEEEIDSFFTLNNVYAVYELVAGSPRYAYPMTREILLHNIRKEKQND